MSLVKTLAKVAIGVAIAKGAKSILANKSAGGGSGGGPFGGQFSPDRMTDRREAEKGLGDLLGGQGGTGGGLGGLLESLSTAANGPDRLDDRIQGASQGGGLGNLIESLSGRGASGGGGLGSILGGLAGMAAGGSGGANGSFSDLLNQSLQKRAEPEAAPTPEQDAVAGLMLRSMIQAMKSDGQIDAAERAKLLDNLGDDVSAEERAFVQREMEAPVDIAGLARQVPEGMETQVYAMSLMAIDLDNRNEALYLHNLAQAMGMRGETVNLVHDKFGAPRIA